MLTIEQCATLACLLEVTAPKPGNVHRGADFEDTTFLDFAASAVAIGPAMRDAPRRSVGATILAAIQATREVTRVNTNLGIVLLIAPLAACPRHCTDRPAAISQIMRQLDTSDARDIYAAIRLASPGGLGTAAEMDVAGVPPHDILAAMRAAANRDLVARQYVCNFEIVFAEVVPKLELDCQTWGLMFGIVNSHVWLMSRYADSLISRKAGPKVAEAAKTRAQRVVDAGSPNGDAFNQSLADLDFWLRSDGSRRNPGTTADLITAGLFVALLDGRVNLL